MTDNEFARIVKYTSERYGINLFNKKVIVEGRLDNYLEAHGYKSYDEYMDSVEADFTGNEAQNLVNILTTNHTYFMRESDHFEFLKEVILPQIREREKNTKDLRIWCAAASSGEEPYTIAMIIKDFFGLDYPNWETSILATDISVKVLEEAVRGVYSEEKVENLPQMWKKSNFIHLPTGEYQVKPEIREKVIFRQFNLMNPLPFKRKLQVVFLRNVMIYFDEETKRQLVDKIYDFLEPGGYLIIGSTESINKSNTRFHYVKPSIFRK
jgi:chemotaxis protein methyltransferase CheR